MFWVVSAELLGVTGIQKIQGTEAVKYPTVYRGALSVNNTKDEVEKLYCRITVVPI